MENLSLLISPRSQATNDPTMPIDAECKWAEPRNPLWKRPHRPTAIGLALVPEPFLSIRTIFAQFQHSHLEGLRHLHKFGQQGSKFC